MTSAKSIAVTAGNVNDPKNLSVIVIDGTFRPTAQSPADTLILKSSLYVKLPFIFAVDSSASETASSKLSILCSCIVIEPPITLFRLTDSEPVSLNVCAV